MSNSEELGIFENNKFLKVSSKLFQNSKFIVFFVSITAHPKKFKGSNPFFEYVEQLKPSEEFENLCYITLMLALYPRKNIINVVRWREREKEIIPRTMTMDKDEATPLSYYSRATPIFFPMRPRAWGGRRFSICISLPLIALFLFAFYLHPWIPIRYRELVIQRTTTRVGSIEREKENRRTVEEMYKLL